MAARFTASATFSLLLAAMTGGGTGCTVHTYSGAAYPGAIHTRSEPTRYEVSYRTYDRERSYGASREDRRTDRHSDSPAQNDSQIAVRDRGRWTARDARSNGSWVGDTAATTTKGREVSVGKPATKEPTQSDKTATKPRPTTDKDGEAVTLEPTKSRDKYGRVRSFDERLGEVFEQKKAEIARAKKERKTRIERAVANATAEHR